MSPEEGRLLEHACARSTQDSAPLSPVETNGVAYTLLVAGRVETFKNPCLASWSVSRRPSVMANVK